MTTNTDITYIIRVHVYRNMRCKYNVKLPVGEFNLYRIKRYIVIDDIVLCDVDVVYFYTMQNGTSENYRNTRYIVLSGIVLREVGCSPF